MLFRKKKDNEKLDMQRENIYLIEQIREKDWESLKTFDAFFIKFLEIVDQTPALKPIIDKMVVDGFNIEEAKKSLHARKLLRERIIGDKDVFKLKERFRLNVEELNELKIDINYYKDKYKKTNKRPYSEQDFKEKVERQKKLEDWVLKNNWIAHRN